MYQPSDITLALALTKNKKNTIISTTRGQLSFGLFPANNHGFTTGKIILKLGLIGHGYFRKGAFGVRHIWEKHGGEIGLTSPIQVVNFIESILIPGAEVILNREKSPDKPIIVESSNGLITLGLTTFKNQVAYSIITAYDRKNHPGVVIATI